MRRPMLPAYDDLPASTCAAALAAAFAFTLAWAVLAWPWLSGRVTIPWDAKAQFLPQIQFLADSLARGESPFWNPFVFSGHPQVADPQSAIFSPFFILATLNAKPSAWAVDATVFITILLSGLALIAWFRDRGWHEAGAALAAIAFGFGAAMSWRIQHTGQVVSLALLPLVLLFLDRALDTSTSLRRKTLYGLAAGIAAAVLVLGRDQVALLCVYLLAAYALWRILQAPDPAASLRRATLPLSAATLAGLALTALPILLTTALAIQSNRPAIDFAGAGAGSLHPVSALTLFAPDLFGSTGSSWEYWGAPSFAWHERWGQTGLFLAQNMGQLYLGAIPALLILVGLGSGVLLRREIIFFTAALAIMTLYALGWYTPFFKLAHTFLPGVSLFRRPADAVFLIGVLSAILAGYTLHTLLTYTAHTTPARLTRGIILAAVTTLTAFATAIVLAVRMDHVAMATQPLIISAAIVAIAAALIADAIWFNPIRPRLAAGLLIIFTVADLAYQNAPGGATGLPPSTYDMLDPSTKNDTIAILKAKTAASASPTRRDRVELAGLGFATPNASITHRLENTLGYNPVRLGLYSRATGAIDTVGLPQDRKFTPMFPSYRSQLADLLGLAYVASSVPLQSLDPQAKLEDFPLIAKTADGFIYENPRALPRAIFAASAAPADFDAILNTGNWPDADLTGTVLLSPDDERESGLIATRGHGFVAIKTYSNTKVEIDVDSTRGGFVVLNDLWHPWWIATLDGATPAPVLRANVLFRAVRVPNGRHTVTFTFAPIRGVLGNWHR
ncbi:MAG: hypothetical protein ABL901_17325 [Hyphomicrobiaceae bacterium]